MDSKTKNIIYIVVAVVAVVLIIAFVSKGMNPTGVNNATSTTDTNYNGAGGTQQPTTKKTASNTVANTTVTTPSLENIATLTTIIGNALVHVPQTGTDVALTAGGADYSDSNGRVQGRVQSGPILKWVKTDVGYDVFTDMTLTKNGQPQVLHYVALFHVTSSTNVEYTSSVLVGDRLPVVSVVASPDPSVKVNPSSTVMSSALGYILTINYMERKNGEAITATPTLAKSLAVRVKNHVVGK